MTTSIMSGAISRHLLRYQRAVSLDKLNQGSTLSLRSSIPNVSVRIQSGWRDDGQATLRQHFQTQEQAKELLAGMKVSEEVDQMTSLGRTEAHLAISLDYLGTDEDSPAATDNDADEEWKFDPDSHYSFTVQVPEKVNLICDLTNGGNINVTNKIEGDVKLTTTDGKIHAKKLRGHTVELETQTENGVIYSSDLLEAQNLRINLQGGRFRAKRIHGDAVDINVSLPEDAADSKSNNPADPLDDDDEGSMVDISSMYVSGTGGAQIVLGQGLQPVKRGVRVKSHHGPVVVTADGVGKPLEAETCPLVELGSVNGSCEVSVRGVPDSENWTACQVHYDSISPESVSLISVETGNVGLTIDRKLEADIRLLSCSDTTTLEEKSSLLADDDDSQKVLRVLSGLDDTGMEEATKTAPEPSRISITTKSYTNSVSYVSDDNKTEYVEGWVENMSHEPDSRFEMKTRGEEAAHSVGKIRLDGAANQALKNFSGPQLSAASTRPLIVAASGGNITVETLSWLGAIARRYGLNEEGRDLGRQATRRGRVVVPADE